MVTRRYRDSDCDIGGIVGTGTNFCYLELLNNIHTLQAKQKEAFPRKQMIINIESGNFDKIPQNAYDRTLDNNSTNRGEHITEKMVSGLYLGELTRLVMIDLIEKGLLFSGQLREGKISRTLQRGSFPTPFLTEIAEDNSPSLKGVQAKLKLWGIKDKHISLEDRRMVKEICSVVDRRAARITAAVIFAIVTHIDENIVRRHTIAIDGSVFEKHTGFKKDMRVAIRELSLQVFGNDRSDNVSFELTHDGSGIGAAIIAATSV
jgi:hexokinase